MKRFLALFLTFALAIGIASAQTPTNSIIIDAASFRPVQSDALTGIAIDPIGLDGSNRPCTRLKMRINRMTRKEISELSFRLRGGIIDLRKCEVAYEGNGLIIEMTAHTNTRFYLHHERFGSSNEVQISTEGNKEYYIEASLNQLYPITIASNAAEAEVYIDEQFVGRTNAECVLMVEKVLPGPHRLKMLYDNTKIETTIDVNRRSVYFRHYFTAIQNATPDKPSDFCEMIFVKGGAFIMGATQEQGDDIESNEKPTHRVSVADFYIGKYEVTQAQWEAVMGNNPGSKQGDSNKLPVDRISLKEINEFIEKLNEKTGQKYRLPTEEEWEYAARGGNQSRNYKYSGSNRIDDVAWYRDNSNFELHQIGTKQPNELGIYDMSGNVYEWCSNYLESYSTSTNSLSARPQPRNIIPVRVFRGGGNFSDAKRCRVSYRGYDIKMWYHQKYRDFGLRLVLEP